MIAEWAAELSVEIVTHSRETRAEALARLMNEHPSAPEQLRLRRELEAEAHLRVQLRLLAEARTAQVNYTPLERRLGEARIQALMDELADNNPWINHPERKHAS
jgi:hypothetical protein